MRTATTPPQQVDYTPPPVICLRCHQSAAGVFWKERHRLVAYSGACRCAEGLEPDTYRHASATEVSEGMRAALPAQRLIRCVTCGRRAMTVYEYAASVGGWFFRGGRCGCQAPTAIRPAPAAIPEEGAGEAQEPTAEEIAQAEIVFSPAPAPSGEGGAT